MIYYKQRGGIMWSRESIKDYAKEFLKTYYWKAFLVCLIVFILGGYSIGGFEVNSNLPPQNSMSENLLSIDIPIQLDNSLDTYLIRKIFNNPIFYVSILQLIVFFGLILLIAIFFTSILNVGKVKFFLKAFEGDVQIKYLFSGFTKKDYWLNFKTIFLTDIYILLWSLLLLIPGIIKSYEYRFVPYILAESPDLTANEIISKSRQMTKGHKWDIFVLDLSFIGWELLAILLFGIGIIFVNPYKESTYARLYNILSTPSQIDDNIVY